MLQVRQQWVCALRREATRASGALAVGVCSASGGKGQLGLLSASGGGGRLEAMGSFYNQKIRTRVYFGWTPTINTISVLVPLMKIVRSTLTPLS